ncbi:MAG: ABC transporter substrate-binding protein/permease [Bdellovibrionota bacterium]
MFRWLLILSMLLVAVTPLKAEKQSLRVGLTGKYPPFNYFDPNGKLTGFDVEMAEAICAEIERKCVFVPLAWDGILAALLAGRIDAIIGSMAITPEREKKVLFSQPYYESGAQLLASSTAPPATDEGFRIGVTLGTTYKTFAEKAFPKATVRSYKGDVEVLQDIVSGRLDAIVTDKLVGLYMARSMNADLVPVGEPLYLERMGIPVGPGETDLLNRINQSITKIRSSKAYPALFTKYFGKASHSASSSYSLEASLSLMARALGTTVGLSAQGIFLGCLVSILVASLMLFSPRSLAVGVAFIVDFVRATPFMVQLFAIYFGLPSLGLRISPWASAVLAIALHSAAYLAEVIKVAYQSVPLNQHYAARTLGLSRRQAVVSIISPQMLPVLVAPTLNTVVAMIKDSAIVSVISVHELMMQTQELISATFQPMEFYLLAAFLYFVVTYPLLLLGRGLEKTFRRKGLLNG